MNAEITIITNRIHFEQYQSGGDSPDEIEIQQAWERAIYKVIESAGFSCETKVGIGYDPAVSKIVTVEPCDLECECDDDEPCECSEKLAAEVKDYTPFVERYGESVAEQAIEVAKAAAWKRAEELGVAAN